MKMLLYNENSFFNAHTTLQSTPVTIDVDPVGISIPSGALRLNYDKPFTHIQFEFSGEPYICKVTNVKNLGGDLNEYSYTIDYLKDYVNKYGLTGQDIVIERSTDIAIWKRFVIDNLYPRGNNLLYSHSTDKAVSAAVMLVINYDDGVGELKEDCETYIIPLMEWSYVQKALLNPMTYNDEHSEIKTISPEFVTTAIRGAYIIPWNDDYSQTTYQFFTPQQYITIYAKGADGEGNTRVLPTKVGLDEHTVYKMGGTNTPLGMLIPFGGRPNIIKAVTDWHYIEFFKYSAYAPFYGAFELNPQHFDGIYYHISPSSGMVSVSTVLNDIAGMLNPQRLPEINYITDTSVTAQRIINQQAAISTGAVAAQTTLSIAISAVGAATGNAMLTAGGVLGAVQSVGNSLINTQASRANQLYSLSQQGLQYSQQTGTFGTRINHISYTRVEVGQPISFAEFRDYYGGYCNYKIGDSMPESVLSKRCWLNLTGARIRGADWYAAGVKAALDGVCIIID